MKKLKSKLKSAKRRPIKPKRVKNVTRVEQDGDLEYEDVVDMFDDDELQQLEESYVKKRSIDAAEDGHKPKKVRYLLPIKSSEGIIPRFIVEKEESSDDDDDGGDDNVVKGDDTDSDEKPVEKLSTVQILAKRMQLLSEHKMKIGSLCSDLLEAPEEKIANFKYLFEMYDSCEPEVFLTVRKLLMTSILEVFKDILPSYPILKHDAEKDQKLKKETIQLHRYENLLLQYYQKYLQRLENVVVFLLKMKRTSTHEKEKMLLAQLAVKCYCNLIEWNPYFNFADNIANLIVPFLQSPLNEMRLLVFETLKNVFKADKKADVSLKIVQRINRLIKQKTVHIRSELVDLLNHLPIGAVNLEVKKEQELKVRRLQLNKKRILNLSKKEKKRQKRIKEVEKELLETKAEENKEVKQKNLTEITKLVFLIYLRVLKYVSNSKILLAALKGLSKFAQCINLEFYSDIVTILMRLMNESEDHEWIKKKERVFCINTILNLLSGCGDVLNIDPSQCYVHLYNLLLDLNIGKNHVPLSETVIETLSIALSKRSKKISSRRLLAFAKRLATICLQNHHNTSLALMAVLRHLIQTSRDADILLDLDKSVGQGRFLPELEDPEYSNASNTALWELLLLKKSYHPTVRLFANHAVFNFASSGEGSLPLDLVNKSPEELFNEFDWSLVQLNPDLEEPKPIVHKKRVKNWFGIKDIDFQSELRSKIQQKSIQIDDNNSDNDNEYFDF